MKANFDSKPKKKNICVDMKAKKNALGASNIADYGGFFFGGVEISSFLKDHFFSVLHSTPPPIRRPISAESRRIMAESLAFWIL